MDSYYKNKFFRGEGKKGIVKSIENFVDNMLTINIYIVSVKVVSMVSISVYIGSDKGDEANDRIWARGEDTGFLSISDGNILVLWLVNSETIISNYSIDGDGRINVESGGLIRRTVTFKVKNDFVHLNIILALWGSRFLKDNGFYIRQVGHENCRKKVETVLANNGSLMSDIYIDINVIYFSPIKGFYLDVSRMDIGISIGGV